MSEEPVHSPSPSNALRYQPLHPFITYGSILAVFVVNLVILGYAISVSVPPETIIVPAGNSQTEGAPTEPAPADTAGVAVVDEATRDLAEFGDWSDERVEVVNIFDLPSEETIKAQFDTHCTICHGPSGEGDGPAAEFLLPRPRDFIGSPLRYATRGGSRTQIILDIERTITQGVPRSAMPGFGGVLDEPTIAGLAQHVLRLREEGEGIDELMEEPAVDVGMRPPWTPELVARGKELFTALACNTCHGDGGRGDGINASSLVDMQGKPVRPADLTSGLFKTGQTPEDLVRTIMKGVPGTPMVAYELALTQENEDFTVNVMDAWALVAFIRSLRVTPQPPGQASGAEITVHLAPDEAMLTDPSHIAWLGAEPILVEVKPLYQREEHTTHLEVRAVQFGDRLGLCLDWHDTTLDLIAGDDLFPDAAAVMFGLGGGVPPMPLDLNVGVSAADETVRLWHWSAARHCNLVSGRECTAEDLDTAQSRGWRVFAAEPPEGASVDVRAALEESAAGIGRHEAVDSAAQDVISTAAWSRNVWRVVLVRSLDTAEDADVRFTSEARIPISFALWNGSKGDNGGNKLMSGWHWLTSTPASADVQ